MKVLLTSSEVISVGLACERLVIIKILYHHHEFKYLCNFLITRFCFLMNESTDLPKDVHLLAYALKLPVSRRASPLSGREKCQKDL